MKFKQADHTANDQLGGKSTAGGRINPEFDTGSSAF